MSFPLSAFFQIENDGFFFLRNFQAKKFFVKKSLTKKFSPIFQENRD